MAVKRPAKAKTGARRKRARKVAAKKRVPAKRRAVKKPGRKAVGARRPAETGLEKVGEVTHYFPKVKAAAVLVLKDSVRVGDGIYIKGHTTDFKEKIASIQLDRVPIQEGKKGQEIGLLVKSRVRIGDSVYKL